MIGFSLLFTGLDVTLVEVALLKQCIEGLYRAKLGRERTGDTVLNVQQLQQRPHISCQMVRCSIKNNDSLVSEFEVFLL